MDDAPRVQLVTPPRHVPLLLRGALLFGGLLSQFGWIFLGFGTIFVWMFAMRTDPTEPFDFWGPLETAEGRIVHREESGFSRGRRERSNSRPVMAHHYEYSVDGMPYEGISYSADRRAVGARVTVEFPVGNPQRSRIEGMRAAVVPPWLLVTLLFPVFGLGAVVPGLRHGWKAGSLLKWGRPAFGRLKDQQPTDMRINDRRVMKFTFEFTGELGEQHEAIGKTHHTRLLEDDEWELLLYDPADPTNSTLIDHLHGSPYVDENGQIHVRDTWISLLVLVVPLVTIVGHSVYMAVRFL